MQTFLINNFQAVHKLVDSNQKLKHHIKPHLSVPNYTKLKDSSKLSSIKINNMMGDLVEFINELVDDQIQMRSCIPLTPDLRDFYKKLMGRDVDKDDDSSDNQIDDVYGDDEGERYERFLTPKKRFTRKVVSLLSEIILVNVIDKPVYTQATFKRGTAEEIDEKCAKVRRFQTRSAGIPLSDKQKKYFEKFFTTHNRICDEMKSERKRKRTPNYPANASQDFIKLDAFKSYVSEANVNDL